jgi:hypothetical protein
MMCVVLWWSSVVCSSCPVALEGGFLNYTGPIQNGLPHGNGTGIFSNDGETPISTYTGPWKNGLQHGYGEEYWENEEYFIGNWIEGLKSGTGRYIYSNGHMYVGSFKNGLRHTERRL